MQTEGKPVFLNHHLNSVRGVGFSPKDRYLFCSGSYDGHVLLYSAQRLELLTCYKLKSNGSAKNVNVNAVKFSSDGTMILVATSARRVGVIDIECGEQLITYDDCAFAGRDRTALATHPVCPNIAVCVASTGKGLTLLDLRMPLPLKFIYDIHDCAVRDVAFTSAGWPWARSHQASLLIAASDGVVKATTFDGKVLHSFDTGHCLSSVTTTPEPFCLPQQSNTFHSLIVSGGESISAYVPDVGLQEILKDPSEMPVIKLRYSSNGAYLYACAGGVLRKYRRYPDHHQYLGEVYRHKSAIWDMDISSYDEYLITASKDRTVGVLLLGPPNHGSTEYGELT